MSVLQFQDELRRLARYDRRPAVENPLAAAILSIKANPMIAQSRLLNRMLVALTYERGEFRRAEASAFDSATLGLVIALMNAARAGTTGRTEWESAVAACDEAA